MQQMRVWEYQVKPSTMSIAERGRRRHAQCAVRDCWKPATQISQYCKLHYDRNRKAGHPEARRISTKALRWTLSSAKQVIWENIKHPAVQDALHAIEQMLDWGRRNGAGRWARGREDDGKRRAMLWLAHVDATPRELFTKIVALYMLEQSMPAFFPDDGDRAVLKMAIGQHVLKSIPKGVGPESRRAWEWPAGHLTKQAAMWVGDRLHARIGITAARLARGEL
jgi:hypothetical protein